MSNFKQIKDKFNDLTSAGKEQLLKDAYNFSNDMKLFLENRFLGGQDNIFINQMEKETIGKIYKDGIPGTPNGKKINEVVSKAKKSRANIWTVIKLEQLAYRGFIEFQNEFGGGPENFDDMACKHMEEYIKLIKQTVKDEKEREQIFNELKKYLKEKDNMCVDSLYDIFELATGIKIREN